jgi:uncharacterized delta-60 repeat protein
MSAQSSTTRFATPTSWAAPFKVRKAALFFFLGALLLATGVTESRAQSALDGFDPNANGEVRVVVVQPDGKILIGGTFSALAPNGGPSVTRKGIARLNPDGTLDAAFDPNVNPPGVVLAMAVQPDGKILVGGIFSSIGGQPRNNIARLDGATGLADSFSPNATSTVHSLVVQADGRILAGGQFTSIGGQMRSKIARLDPLTGQADSFDPNADDIVLEIAAQPDGKILAGGYFSNIGGQARNRIARLDPVTGQADSFDPNSDDIVNSIALQADGKILVGGSFDNIGGQTRHRIARLDSTTGGADSFGANGASGSVTTIAVQSDGKILAGGNFGSIGGQARSFIARLDPSTGLADAFDPSASDSVFSIAVQPDGKVLLGGRFSQLSPSGGAATARNRIARVEVDGGVDRTLDVSVGGIYVAATAIQADGKVLIGGLFSSVLGVARNNIARLNTDGTLDAAFNPNANNEVRAIAVQADGKILAGGDFTSIGGQTRNRMARLDPTTGSADSFDPNPNGSIDAIAVEEFGEILAGGSFTRIGGEGVTYLARLNPATGGVRQYYANVNGRVVSIAVQADGKILVGGFFTRIGRFGGSPRRFMGRLDDNYATADSFNPNPNDVVYAIAVQSDGKILAGGQFNGADSIGGQTRNFMARLDPATGLADSFNPNANARVLSIALQSDGKVLAGGEFNGPNSIGGQTRNRIARLDPTTGLADSFNPDTNGNFVLSIALQADGKVLAGGDFTSIGGQTRNRFARLNNDTAALQSLDVTRHTVTWTLGGSSPQFAHVILEDSSDNVLYFRFYNVTSVGSNWTVSGLRLSTERDIYVRARGYSRSGYQNASESITQSVRHTFLRSAPQVLNLSTRMRVQSGNEVLISGFIVTGNAPKKVAVRGIGPSLFSSLDRLGDPTLELHAANGALIAQNDNWQSDPAQAEELRELGLALNDSRESGIVISLQPGAYTAILAGKNGGAGQGLVEIYDTDDAADSLLANISTRGHVLTGDNILIGGFILGGSNDSRIAVRGIGPSLAQFGLNPVLADPTLDLYDSHGTRLVSNDDWANDPVSADQLRLLGLAPQNPKESGIVQSLPPGAFTTILSGTDGGTGIGLVEIYDVP